MPIKLCQLAESPQDDARIGPGRAAGRTGIVTDAELGDGAAQPPRLGEHLGINQRTGTADRDLLQEGARVDLERAVDITQPQTEEPVHQARPQGSIESAQGGILPVEAIGRHDVVHFQQRQEPGQLPQVELSVTIRVKNPVLRRRPEAGGQGGAVPAVGPEVQDPHGRVLGRERVGDGARAVAAAVVDDQDFKIGRHGSTDGECGVRDAFQVGLFVVARKEDREGQRLERWSDHRVGALPGSAQRARPLRVICYRAAGPGIRSAPAWRCRALSPPGEVVDNVPRGVAAPHELRWGAPVPRSKGLETLPEVLPIRVGVCGTTVVQRNGRWYTHHSMGRVADVLAGRFRTLRFYGPRASAEGLDSIDHAFEAANLEVVPWDVPRATVRAMRNPRALLRAYRAMAGEVDALILRGNPPLIWAAHGYARQSGIPVVHWVVGNSVAILRGEQRGFRGVMKQVAIAFACAEQKFTRWAIRRSGAAVLANGDELAQLFATPRTQSVVSTTLSAFDFLERSDTCQGSEVRVIFVGFVRPEKGLEYLIRALPSLGATPPVQLTIVGSWGQFEGERNRLAGLVEQLGLTARVEWAGYAPFGPELFAQLDRSDVMVLPSLSEGTPRVLVEARARSLPVISTRVGGIPSSVRDGEDGLLVPPRDAGAIAAALERIIRDGELRRRLIATGRERMRELTMDRFVDRMVLALRQAARGDQLPAPGATNARAMA